VSPDLMIDPDLLRRVRGEYLEMPGLHLTPRQAERLWGLDAQTCHRLFDALLASRFLCRTRIGTFRLAP